MSHIVMIETEVRDPAAIRSACDRLNLQKPVFEEVKLFSGAKTGWAVRLPEWRYPIVCDVNTGKLAYDDFGGRWGDQRHLDAFMQAYSVEKAKLEARRKGYSCMEQTQEDGSIRLSINAGGVA